MALFIFEQQHLFHSKSMSKTLSSLQKENAMSFDTEMETQS